MLILDLDETVVHSKEADWNPDKIIKYKTDYGTEEEVFLDY